MNGQHFPVVPTPARPAQIGNLPCLSSDQLKLLVVGDGNHALYCRVVASLQRILQQAINRSLRLDLKHVHDVPPRALTLLQGP